MQYLLTEAEWQELNSCIKNEKKKLQEILQDLCTKVCDHMPIEVAGIPYGCVLSSKDNWYCDRCLVKTVCPNPNKHYSK